MTHEQRAPEISGPRLSAVLGLWLDRPHDEPLETAVIADEVGFEHLWIGEMATWDAFALATAIGHRTDRISFMIGPLAVGVRDPMMVAVGAASVRELTGRRVGIALGSSSKLVVEQWHGREWRPAGARLDESAQIVRSLLTGSQSDFSGEFVSSNGYHLRLPAPPTQLAIAAFGRRAVSTAATHGDQMVINLVTPKSAAMMREQLDKATDAQGLPRKKMVAWLRTAVDPDESTLDQLRRGLVTYLGAQGYTDMFTDAGFGDLAAYARTRPHPGELLAAVPDELVMEIGLVGDSNHIAQRLNDYVVAGVDEIAIVPATAGDPAGERTLRNVWSIAQEAGLEGGSK